MLNEFRKIDLTWDRADQKFYKKIRASSSDEAGRKMVVQVLNNGEVEDLTGVSLFLYWTTKNLHYNGLDVFKAIDASKGIFELQYTTGMLSNVGDLTSYLHLFDGTGTVTSEPFLLTVFEGINTDALESDNSFTALTQALIRVEEIEAQEDTRKSNEQSRVSAENTRKTNENTRINSETSRKDAETNRENSEADRVSYENSRQVAEDARKDNENERIQSENTRITNETNRDSAESLRETHEQDRGSAEDIRENNEQLRISDENERHSAEADRVAIFEANEQSRQNTYTQSESDRDVAFEASQVLRELDYQALADDLELTYSPRLLNLENELEDDVRPRLSDIESGRFDSPITYKASTTTADDATLLRFERADGTLIAFLSTAEGGTGLKLHMFNHADEWLGYMSIDEDGTIRQNGVPVALN